MSRPMLLIFHPDPMVAAKLHKIGLSIGARAHVVDDVASVPTEVRKYGPNLVLLPWSEGAGMEEALLRMVQEDTPLARVVLLVGEGARAEIPAGAFGRLQVHPAISGEEAVKVFRDASEHGVASGAVLVVEDQPINLEMVADVLHAKGYRVLRAMTGEESIELAIAGGPDMVLMDIHLPGMSGIDAVRKLKAMPSTSRLPIVMLSANGTDSTITDALESGAIDFVVKPFSPRRLLEKVALVLEKRELLAHA